MKAKNIFSGFISSQEITDSQKEKKNVVLDKFSISFLKHSFWVNYAFKATIDQDGLLRINENSAVNNLHRVSDYHLADTDLALIKEKLLDVTTIDFNNNYGFGENKPDDLPVTFIQYYADERADSTSIYFPEKDELPEELNLFLSTLKQIINDHDFLIPSYQL